MMQTLSTITGIREKVRDLQSQGQSIGFVATMGALHQGHVSLVDEARRKNDIVVVSVFVNPTQFNDPTDLDRYPRTVDDDRRMLAQAGVDVLFVPSAEEIYHDDGRFSIIESLVSKRLEGTYRPGHFQGVMTVVMKLLGLIQPDRAYFGEKDWQQYVVIRDMAEAFFLGIEIVACPVVREKDGLAMSSRNANLSPEERAKAGEFSSILRGPTSLLEKRQALGEAGFDVEYVEKWDGRILGAVVLGSVRLIDNFDISETEVVR